MRSLDGYDNVAVFFNDSGKVVPYEHEYKRPTPGQRQAKPIFDPSIPREKEKRMKIGKESSDVTQVKYLPRAH